MFGAASLGGLDPAPLDPASLGGLDPADWKCNERGEIKNGEPRCKDDDDEEYAAALFKHSQSLETEDVLRMKVVAGGNAIVGFAGMRFETDGSTAWVGLFDGSTCITSDISKDGEEHFYHGLLKDHIPETLPYDLALRINKDGNMPQLWFNEDGQCCN